MIAAAEVPHMARPDQLVDSEERLVERDARVIDVQEEQVDTLDAQAPQRCLDSRPDGGGGQARMIGALADLRRDGEGVAVAALAHPVADHDLAAPARIRIGSIDERALQLDEAVEDGSRGGAVSCPPEYGAAQRDRKHLEGARTDAPGDGDRPGLERRRGLDGGFGVDHGADVSLETPGGAGLWLQRG